MKSFSRFAFNFILTKITPQLMWDEAKNEMKMKKKSLVFHVSSFEILFLIQQILQLLNFSSLILHSISNFTHSSASTAITDFSSHSPDPLHHREENFTIPHEMFLTWETSWVGGSVQSEEGNRQRATFSVAIIAPFSHANTPVRDYFLSSSEKKRKRWLAYIFLIRICHEDGREKSEGRWISCHANVRSIFLLSHMKIVNCIPAEDEKRRLRSRFNLHTCFVYTMKHQQCSHIDVCRPFLNFTSSSRRRTTWSK